MFGRDFLAGAGGGKHDGMEMSYVFNAYLLVGRSDLSQESSSGSHDFQTRLEARFMARKP